MRFSFAWFAIACTVVGGGCVRLDPDHCANKGEPRVYCDAEHDVAYCSSCEAADNGCTSKRPSGECDPVGGIADTGGTTTSGSMSATMSSTSMDPVTTMSTTESMDSSTTEDIEPGCGNGVRDQTLEENCDTDDIPAMDCADVGLMPGDTDGSVGCYPEDHALECTYDLTGCDGVAVCGNSMIEGTEQCDMAMLAGETCESLSDDYIGGTLTCTTGLDGCTFNTSGCVLCGMNGDPCTVSAECCGGNLCLLENCL